MKIKELRLGNLIEVRQFIKKGFGDSNTKQQGKLTKFRKMKKLTTPLKFDLISFVLALIFLIWSCHAKAQIGTLKADSTWKYTGTPNINDIYIIGDKPVTVRAVMMVRSRIGIHPRILLGYYIWQNNKPNIYLDNKKRVISKRILWISPILSK